MDTVMEGIVVFVFIGLAVLSMLAVLWYLFQTVRIMWEYNSLLAIVSVIFSPIVHIIFYFMPKDNFDKHEAGLFKKYFLSIGLIALLGIVAAVVIPATQAQNSIEVMGEERLIELAREGDVTAQNRLVTMYVRGDEVPQDYEKAFYWSEKAAEQGDAQAQLNLGLRYFSGEGAPQDNTKAAELFELAAEQGLSDAQHNIATMYSTGTGVRQDYNMAFKWHEKAANQGFRESMTNLAWLYKQGNGVNQDSFKALEWYQKAADKGEPYAQYNLGVLYNTGEGVRQDHAQAKEWFGKACDNGNQNGCNMYKNLN